MINYLRLISDRVKNSYDIDNNSNYIIEYLDPSALIVPQRMDVIIKLYYIDAKMRGMNMDYPTYVYKSHIHSITHLTDTEKGQEDYKNSTTAFLNIFDQMIESFKVKGFDDEESVLPISEDNILLDGAHRLACAIYFKTQITAIRFKHVSISGKVKPGIYNYIFFKDFLLPQDILDLSAIQYIKYSNKNLYMACIWPSIKDQSLRNKAIDRIERAYKVVYKKELKLSFIPFNRLVSQIYIKDPWVGSIGDGFSGSPNKSRLCYGSNSLVSFILFEGDNKENVLKLKENIRELIKLGKHSIHITDTTDETRFIANIVFNDNSVSFLKESNFEINSKAVSEIVAVDAPCYNLKASQIVWGLVNGNIIDNNEDYRITQESLNSSYTIEDIVNNPNNLFYFVGKRFIYPNSSTAGRYLADSKNGPLLDTKKSIFSAFIKYSYNFIKLTKLKFDIQTNKIKLFIKNKITS